MVERSGLVATRAIRAEAQGICSGSPLVERRRVAYGKSVCRAMRFGDFSRSFLPERIFAVRRSVSGMLQGETKSGAVISDDMILKWKRMWSQVAAGLRSPFRQKGPTSAHTFRLRHSDHTQFTVAVFARRTFRLMSFRLPSDSAAEPERPAQIQPHQPLDAIKRRPR